MHCKLYNFFQFRCNFFLYHFDWVQWTVISGEIWIKNLYDKIPFNIQIKYISSKTNRKSFTSNSPHFSAKEMSARVVQKPGFLWNSKLCGSHNIFSLFRSKALQKVKKIKNSCTFRVGESSSKFRSFLVNMYQFYYIQFSLTQEFMWFQHGGKKPRCEICKKVFLNHDNLKIYAFLLCSWREEAL